MAATGDFAGQRGHTFTIEIKPILLPVRCPTFLKSVRPLGGSDTESSALSRARRSQSVQAFVVARKVDRMGVMGRLIPNIQPLLLEIKTKEAQLRAQETEYARVLSRLEGLEVSGATKAIVQRYVNGELTIKDLNIAIDEYLSLNAISRNQRP